ncbi:nucleotidyltransferase [Paenibacillus sp. 2TAB19]|uniref:nucleotidyltransferase n=1 Tax=Paenibacillus sp. 2TAB19 TaxID=3233003 RepID=UPI003F9B8921
MRTVGLIVEYNPFHNGHHYHLQQSRKITGADTVVAVMSGNFLQRGEPALLDKWSRTRMALEGGCDLVIELPVAYATHAAEWFAYGAVALLEATGVVDAFCFGTESGELAPLQQAADLLADEPPDFRASLKQLLDTGVNYPNAYSAAVAAYLSEQGHTDTASFPFAQPNHTLGLHYLLALRRLEGRMQPFTIAREKSQYNDQTISDSQIASATAIRKLLLEERNLAPIRAYVPSSTYHIIEEQWSAGHCPISWTNFMQPLLHQTVTRSASQLAELRDISEGMEHRLLRTLPELTSMQFEELLVMLKTKRYTRTRLQRALLSVLLGHEKPSFTTEKLASGVQYIRVLGFTEKGKQLLRRMRTTSSLPVLLSAARAPEPYSYLELDTRASAVYMLGRGDTVPSEALFRDFKEKPVIL